MTTTEGKHTTRINFTSGRVPTCSPGRSVECLPGASGGGNRRVGSEGSGKERSGRGREVRCVREEGACRRGGGGGAEETVVSPLRVRTGGSCNITDIVSKG